MSPTFIINFVKISFAVVGAVALAAALWFYLSTSSFVASAMRAEGVVIDLERSRSSDSTMYSPVVRFTAADGMERTFVTSWSSSSPAYSRGDTVQVLYQADQPADAKVEGLFSLWGLVLIPGAFGAIFFLIGGGMIAYGLFYGARKRSLQANGRLVLADVRGVERNGSLKVNGSHPWRVMCQWQDPATRKVHVFASDNFWFDPTDYVTQKQINVRIDPKNPKRHWVDTTFLPEMA
ncbi:DUF3592 domain-containing protein [Rhizobiales bacterium RZME27]|uniref:DUF3592 domain-containing protein n=1 Tax=Endobacterium cereale TaxID=2663029 RepID=A0A6A8A3B6_9HYPH|nr:DUF3592 domain-containing protein [Endobacterium cereale]MEB2846276.1 DUF3592 domain-containing protein [Endobacterium cereale]MQY45712.1 DUF3592 domain-containing protein [Endobacterium cereale]